MFDASRIIKSIRCDKVRINRIDHLPDVVMSFESEEDRECIIHGLYRLPDLHVAAQTIQPASKYTGERVN